MDNEEVFEKIVKMYEDKKSHNFILHLVHTFIPIQQNAMKILDNTNKRCCITHSEIISAQQQFEIITSVNVQDLVGSMLDNDKREALHKEISQKRGNREEGYSAEGTDKILSVSALSALHEFTLNRLMCNDHEISKIISNKRKASQL